MTEPPPAHWPARDSPAAAPRIRVVAIVRDEAAAIAGFVDQFRPLGCDCCLLDTGSTDATVALARAAGAWVETTAFTDFAAARNEALDRYSPGADWILMLDADERLDAHTIAHLAALVAHARFDVYLAPWEARHADGTCRTWAPKAFLFRADPALRWVFRVHEKLVGSMRQALLCNARIEHVIALHDDARREAAARNYDALARREPYFTDAGYRHRMREQWPILDYDRTSDPRIPGIHAGPLISVVVPTHDRHDLLRRAVDSALRQDYANVEIVVVGDADPRFADNARAFAAEPRVRTYNLDRNHGPGGAAPRNRGLELARGPLVAYLDDDNAWTPDHLSSVYAALRDAGAAFAFSSMQVDGVDLGFRRPELQGIDTSCIVHRRELIAKYGGWTDPVAGSYHHDWELVSRWVAGGERWACTGRPTLVYNAETSRQREFVIALAARRAHERAAAAAEPAASTIAPAPPPRPRLCLNMIVKNEAAIIGRSLRSVAAVVDCCVICDTGSTDGTPAVIRAFCVDHGIACELHDIPFVDFAQARNEALARARRAPFAYDYLLLVDADMELCVDAPDALASLRAEGALVRQENAAIAYDNVRLVRRDATARYVGATHEVLAVDGDVVRLAGLRFVDHADGANRPGKFARDERLLRAALAADPGDARAMFYLAQTLRDAGQHAEAEAWYGRRVAAGGWDEERFYARYQQALCRLALGDEDAFVAGCLEAHALRPTRAEPLLRLARHYADGARHDAALTLFEQVARMPRPEDDRLFVERDACGDAAREAISIHGYYSSLPARRDAGRRACEALAIDAAATPIRRATARRNLPYYARPLTELCPGTRIVALDVALPPPFVATNPSFARDGDGYRGIVRGVNYALAGGRYEVRDPQWIVRTINRVVRLAADLTLVGARDMADLSGRPTVPGARIAGFEDCRLFRWRDAWWCSATVRDGEADGRAQMTLLRLDAAGDVVAAHPLGGYGDDRHQKNWMPVVDERLRFVYSVGPTLVLDASAADGSVVVVAGTDPGVAIDHWRGGGPLVAWDGGHLGVVHEAVNRPEGRVYLHRFVAFDADLVPVAASDGFVFRETGIEFAAGLAACPGGDALLVSFGAGDSAAFVAAVPATGVRAMLRPFGTVVRRAPGPAG